jgi:hypothetical protein
MIDGLENERGAIARLSAEEHAVSERFFSREGGQESDMKALLLKKKAAKAEGT